MLKDLPDLFVQVEFLIAHLFLVVFVHSLGSALPQLADIRYLPCLRQYEVVAVNVGVGDARGREL